MPVGIVRRDAATTEFFDGTARGELLIRSCACGAFAAPQARTCPACGCELTAWAAAAGTGTVETWSIVHNRNLPPVTVAIVRLDEGPWMQTQLVGDLPDDLRDLRVRVAFEQPQGGEAVPVFGVAG